jgi:hypothetical protein
MEQKTNHSEVARLREQIEREHEAACWALTGLTSGNAQHRFINRRMQRIDAHHQHLAALVGEQESIQIVNQVFEQSPHQTAPKDDPLWRSQGGVS